LSDILFLYFNPSTHAGIIISCQISSSYEWKQLIYNCFRKSDTHKLYKLLLN